MCVFKVIKLKWIEKYIYKVIFINMIIKSLKFIIYKIYFESNENLRF